MCNVSILHAFQTFSKLVSELFNEEIYESEWNQRSLSLWKTHFHHRWPQWMFGTSDKPGHGLSGIFQCHESRAGQLSDACVPPSSDYWLSGIYPISRVTNRSLINYVIHMFLPLSSDYWLLHGVVTMRLVVTRNENIPVLSFSRSWKCCFYSILIVHAQEL